MLFRFEIVSILWKYLRRVKNTQTFKCSLNLSSLLQFHINWSSLPLLLFGREHISCASIFLNISTTNSSFQTFRYCVLSKFTRDVLSILVFIVVFEFIMTFEYTMIFYPTFNTVDYVLDLFWSDLSLAIIESLIYV